MRGEGNSQQEAKREDHGGVRRGAKDARGAEGKGISRSALIFVLSTAFLNLSGVGLVAPVTAFLVGLYVADANAIAVATGLLFTAYSLCQFLALPGLGALSDKFGRRPVLLVCLFGSAVGYLAYGIGGALWVLFLGRIIDGVTGGNIGTIYAFIADLIEPQERARYYGLIGAVGGFGFVVGPAVGGLLAKIGGTTAPMYFAAAITLVNVVWGYFAMPESLPADRRSASVTAGNLNPFTQLFDIMKLPQVRWLLFAAFLYTLPFAALQSNLAVFAKDLFGWQAADVAGVFVLVGVIGVIVQGGLIRPLIGWFGELPLAVTGLSLLAIGFGMIAFVPTLQSVPFLFASIIVFSLGNGLLMPTLTALTSQTVGRREQGRIQGGSQSVQAMGRVFGPLYSSAAYVVLSISAPYAIGVIFLVLSALCVLAAIPSLKAAKMAREAPAQ